MEALGDEQATEALDYLRELIQADDALTLAEWEAVREGEAQMARGEYVTLGPLRG